jgi:hypothetical protein
MQQRQLANNIAAELKQAGHQNKDAGKNMYVKAIAPVGYMINELLGLQEIYIGLEGSIGQAELKHKPGGKDEEGYENDLEKEFKRPHHPASPVM